NLGRLLARLTEKGGADALAGVLNRLGEEGASALGASLQTASASGVDRLADNLLGRSGPGTSAVPSSASDRSRLPPTNDRPLHNPGRLPFVSLAILLPFGSLLSCFFVAVSFHDFNALGLLCGLTLAGPCLFCAYRNLRGRWTIGRAVWAGAVLLFSI